MTKKMLVVDNHPLLLKLLSNLLVGKGYEVLVAEDGLRALEILETVTPAMIFTDLVMPNIGGDKLCRIVRSMPRFNDTYIVLISGIAAEERLDFRSWGANACIAKGPFKELATHVEAVLERAALGGVSDSTAEVLGLDTVFQREVTKELLFSNKHFQVTLNNMSEGILELARDRRIVYANPAAVAVTGVAEEKMLGARFVDLFSEQDGQRIEELLATLAEAPATLDEAEPVLLAGKIVTLAFLQVIHDDQYSVIVIVRDITVRKAAEAELAFEAGLNQAVARVSEMLISAGTMENIAEVILEEAKKLTGSRYGFVGCTDEETRSFRAVTLAGEIWRDCQVVDRNIVFHEFFGLWGWVLTAKQSLLTNSAPSDHRSSGVPEGHIPIDRFLGVPALLNGQLIGMLALANPDHDYGNQDLRVAERLASLYALALQKQRDEARIEHLAHHDPLTGLVNRHLFNDRLESGLTMARRHKKKLVLLFIDLNDFKLINDSLGHDAGDQVLVEVSRRLLDAVRNSDTVARIGGDEFMVIVHDLPDKKAAEVVAEKMLRRFSQPILVKGKVCSIGACIGISVYPDDGEDGETLQRKADKAMYCVKANGISDFGFYR